MIDRYFIRTQDGDVGRFLRLFTFESAESIDETVRRHCEHPHLRNGQKMLAYLVCALVHGEQAAVSAQKASAGIHKRFRRV